MPIARRARGRDASITTSASATSSCRAALPPAAVRSRATLRLPALSRSKNAGGPDAGAVGTGRWTPPSRRRPRGRPAGSRTAGPAQSELRSTTRSPSTRSRRAARRRPTWSQPTGSSPSVGVGGVRHGWQRRDGQPQALGGGEHLRGGSTATAVASGGHGSSVRSSRDVEPEPGRQQVEVLGPGQADGDPAVAGRQQPGRPAAARRRRRGRARASAARSPRSASGSSIRARAGRRSTAAWSTRLDGWPQRRAARASP